MIKFIRTCQECLHKQEMRHPSTYKGESWRKLLCRKCKSPSLDYGTWIDSDKKIEEIEEE